MVERLPVPKARVGAVELAGPILLASGTAGHSDELAAYVNFTALGGVVVKSMASFEWQGNPSPRLHAVSGGMINAVGLQGRGIGHWVENELPRLLNHRVRPIASIWGFREDEYASAACELAMVSDRLTAVEVNLSCPNLDHARTMFAHDATQATRVVAAVRRELPATPLWVKLSPNTDRLLEVASAVTSAGADALVLVNTVLGMVIDTDSRRPVLGNGGGGVSGSAMHAVAVRSVFDVRATLREVPIVGVGGVSSASDAIELMMAGANAVQIGTATFADPRTAMKGHVAMTRWARRNGIVSWDEIIGSAH